MSWRGCPSAPAMLASGRVTLPLDHYADLLPTYIRQTLRDRPKLQHVRPVQRRHFHDYFVTHLPSSSLHPDSRSGSGLSHKFPRKDSKPHQSDGRTQPAAHPAVSRDTTVVRIPLKSAKHHFGACVSRGSRPYNEDAHQAGVIELPAFAKRPPKSVTDKNRSEPSSASGANGDPQVFYFGVFDGHGGAECSDYLRESLHQYIERTADEFRLQSSLHTGNRAGEAEIRQEDLDEARGAKKALQDIEIADKRDAKELTTKEEKDAQQEHFNVSVDTAPPLIQEVDHNQVESLEKQLVKNWKELVGGYFRRFKPGFFSIYGDYMNSGEKSATLAEAGQKVTEGAAIEEVLAYAFLKADYDFVAAQASKEAESKDHVRAEKPINDEDHILSSSHNASGSKSEEKRFRGGSTCSVAVVSTPSATPFWHPATTSSLMVAHVGDTRVLLCSTSTGVAVPLTTDHHPSAPIEAERLRKYAATFVTDSFGEERISGLANTRAFGDIGSKRIGVSAEPEIRRVEIGAAEYSFMVLVSDGVSGTLNDQEVVDIVKEAKTPEQASRDVISFATEVSSDGDNATCLVIRLGGWERRQEGGYGSLGTREARDYRRQEAMNPRSSRR